MSRWTDSDIPDLSGKVVVVTGANSGLGLATTEVLARRGARVVMACRDEGKGRESRRALLARLAPADGERVTVAHLDLADLASVHAFAVGVQAAHERLDLLINNAGLAFVDPSTTVDGFETQFGVNHLGHMALTVDLLPTLVATPGARVVTVTTAFYRAGRIRLDDPHFRQGRYDRYAAHLQSKLANVMFAVELGRRLAAAGHDTLSLAAQPGVAKTNINTKDVDTVTRLVSKAAAATLPPTRSAHGGARPTVRAATDPHAVSGQLYGPRLKLFGAPTPTTPTGAAIDHRAGSELWELSLRELGIPEPEVLAPSDRRV